VTLSTREPKVDARCDVVRENPDTRTVNPTQEPGRSTQPAPIHLPDYLQCRVSAEQYGRGVVAEGVLGVPTRSRARIMRERCALTLLAFIAVLSGCHTMQFEVANVDHDRVVEARNSFFFWGLSPDLIIDVSQYCPAGVAAVREQTTFLDSLLGAVTLGIWRPRSSWYYCLPEKTNT